MTNLKYTTELKFNRFLSMDAEIPILIEGSSPTKEDVGTGDNSTTVFYFDQKYLIQNSETLYTGSTAESGATTTLVSGVDYSVDYDKSKITLTVSPAGVKSVGTNHLFAEYFYNKFGIKNTKINEALGRAEAQVDNVCNTVFSSGAVSSPGYAVSSDEIHEGQGYFSKVYQLDHYPINKVTATTSGAISVGASTAILSGSTNGFPSTGYVGIGTNKVAYTGKTTSTFTGCTGITASIASGTTVTSWVVERSLTTEGTEPTWEVLSYQSDYDLDWDSGEVKLNSNTVIGSVSFDTWQPPTKVWNRVRFNYTYGYDTIPEDIVRVVHLIAAKELYAGSVLNALSRGTNGFSSEGLQQADEWIKNTLNKYQSLFIKNLNN